MLDQRWCAFVIENLIRYHTELWDAFEQRLVEVEKIV